MKWWYEVKEFLWRCRASWWVSHGYFDVYDYAMESDIQNVELVFYGKRVGIGTLKYLTPEKRAYPECPVRWIGEKKDGYNIIAFDSLALLAKFPRRRK